MLTISNDILTGEVAPSDTDPAIDNWLDTHYIAVGSPTRARGQLLVYLCGSFGIPSRLRLIVHLAARLGYHAIGLSYPNSWTVAALCRRSNDPDCHEKARLAIIRGAINSQLVEVGPANSIENRLTRLLGFLSERQGEQGWDMFLDSGVVRWATITVTGHSQGGGHAALIGKHYTVARVVMLGAPADHVRGENTPATWLGKPGLTPADRYYGFAHARDQGFDNMHRSWESLGMMKYGPSVNIDEEPPPYRKARCLITDTTRVIGALCHASVAVDGATPRLADGHPLFEPVWRYLLL